jgi:hypothetical protein
MILAQSITVVAQEVDQKLSFAIGGTALLILLALMAALVAFGGGREHS